MKNIALLVVIPFLFSCEDETKVTRCYPLTCSEVAIVKDLTGLDGCGLVLEKPDGTRLEPERRTYIQPPTREQDPLYHFQLKAGDSVRFSYKESLTLSTCMVGKIVFITCISSCKETSVE